MTRKLTLIGLTIAITAVLAIVGTIPFFTVEITAAFIPVMVLAVVDGPKSALLAGIGAGIISLLCSVLIPRSPLDPYFINPAVSVLPRCLIGLASFVVYRAMSRLLNKTRFGLLAAYAAAGFTGSVVNTVGVLFMLYVLYFRPITDQLIEFGMPPSVLKFVAGVALSNGLPEAVVSAVVVCAVCAALKRARKAI